MSKREKKMQVVFGCVRSSLTLVLDQSRTEGDSGTSLGMLLIAEQPCLIKGFSFFNPHGNTEWMQTYYNQHKSVSTLVHIHPLIKEYSDIKTTVKCSQNNILLEQCHQIKVYQGHLRRLINSFQAFLTHHFLLSKIYHSVIKK